MSLLDSGSLVGKKNATTTVDLSSRKPIDSQVSAYDFLFKKNKAALEPRTELVLGTPVRKSRGVGGSVCVGGGGGGGAGGGVEKRAITYSESGVARPFYEQCVRKNAYALTSPRSLTNQIHERFHGPKRYGDNNIVTTG